MGARSQVALMVLLSCLAGCGQGETDASLPLLVPKFAPDAEGFFRLPWPSDFRKTQQGTVALGDLPRADNPMMAAYVSYFEGAIRGFSTMPVLYLAFDEPAENVPTPPASATVLPSATVQLLDLANCTERVPLEVVFRASEDPYFSPHPMLLAAPVPGFVLQPARQYAFVVLDHLGASDALGGTARPTPFVRALEGADPSDELSESLAPLRTCLESSELASDDIAIATVFTTQDPTAVLRDLHAFVSDPDRVETSPIEDLETAEKYTVAGAYTTYKATVNMPILQHGESPYETGGGFAYDAAGAPLVARWEPVGFAITLPDPLPVEPLRLAIWKSGARASLLGFVKQGFATDMRKAGFAVAKFLPQFHGSRNVPGGDPDLHTYNFENPQAARAVLLQEALDIATFIRVLREQLGETKLPAIDTTRLVLGGHSQGSVVAAMLAAVDHEISAYVLNGVGTYMSETIVHRTDPFDVPALLALIFGATGTIDRFHPIIQLVQLGAEIVDPNNYLRAWKGTEERPEGCHAMILNGLHDQDVYFTSMNAMTIAADAPPIEPVGWDIDPFGVGTAPAAAPLPIVGNRTSLAGTPLTLASYLDGDSDHFTLYDSEQARTMAVQFLLASSLGVEPPPIEQPTE